MRKRLFVLALALLCTFTQTTAPRARAQNNQAQNQQPKKPAEQTETIRLATTLIEVRAVVTNKADQPITDLKKEDFELLENGKPQEVSFFSFTRVPDQGELAASSANAVGPAATGESPAAALNAAAKANPARSIVLFADTLHLAPGNLLFLKQALRRFLDEKLGAQDLTALVTSFSSSGLGEQFTRDRRLLRYALERLGAGPVERATQFSPYLASLVERNDPMALQEAIRLIQQEDGISGMSQQLLAQLARNRAREVLLTATYRRRITLETLRAAVDRLAQLPGQRLLVLFSDGFSLLDNGGNLDSSALETVTSRATRSGVVIYSVDSRGLAPPPGMSAEFSAAPNFSYSFAAERELQDGLNALAADTGGKFFRNTNDLAGATKQALDDNQYYYTLAYYPTEEGDAKKFRKLTLRIKNQPEYRVRTQKGYLPSALARSKTAAPKTVNQRIAQAIVEPLPATEIGVFATALDLEAASDAAQVTLKIVIDGNTVTYQPASENKQQLELKVVLLVFNASGNTVFNQANEIKGNLSPATYEHSRRNGLQFGQRLVLKPGFYQVRIGVFEPKTERLGTASAIVQVPDLKRKSLTLSSLILADDTSEPTAAQAKNVEQLAQSGSKFVQGLRFFHRNQPFLYFLRLYQNSTQAANPAELELQTEIWQDGQAVRKGEWLPLSSRIVARDAKGLDIGGQLQLTNFPAGIYELRVNVRVRQKKQIVQRVVVFGIDT